MKSLTINIPDTLDADESEMKLVLAAKFYEVGKLSLGQAADMAGCTKREFMEKLSKYGVSIFNHPPEDIERDVTNARHHNR